VDWGIRGERRGGVFCVWRFSYKMIIVYWIISDINYKEIGRSWVRGRRRNFRADSWQF
jgi:hypothetical protein